MTKKIPWTSFRLHAKDWEHIDNIRLIIHDANALQQYFSHEKQPTLWRAIPAFEDLQTAWEAKLESPKFQVYKTAIKQGLTKIGKYYSKFDEKPVYPLSLGKKLDACL